MSRSIAGDSGPDRRNPIPSGEECGQAQHGHGLREAFDYEVFVRTVEIVPSDYVLHLRKGSG